MTEANSYLKTLKIRPIKKIRVFNNVKNTESYEVECLDGRAKWVLNSSILSIKAHLIADGLKDKKFLEFIRNTPIFNLEVITDSGEGPAVFKVKTTDTVECRSGTVRPKGPITMDYYMKFGAEPIHAPDCYSAGAT